MTKYPERPERTIPKQTFFFSFYFFFLFLFSFFSFFLLFFIELKLEIKIQYNLSFFYLPLFSFFFLFLFPWPNIPPLGRKWLTGSGPRILFSPLLFWFPFFSSIWHFFSNKTKHQGRFRAWTDGSWRSAAKPQSDGNGLGGVGMLAGGWWSSEWRLSQGSGGWCPSRLEAQQWGPFWWLAAGGLIVDALVMGSCRYGISDQSSGHERGRCGVDSRATDSCFGLAGSRRVGRLAVSRR